MKESEEAPVRTVSPTFQAISLAEAKKQLELPVDLADHDDHLKLLIEAAQDLFEHDTGLVLPQATYVWKRDEWPIEDIVLTRRPVISISSITYVDVTGTTQTLSTSIYELDTYRVNPSIRLKYDQIWPTHRGHENDITITAVCGHATAAAIPALAKQACLLTVAREFTERTGKALRWDMDAYDRIVRRLARSTYP